MSIVKKEVEKYFDKNTAETILIYYADGSHEKLKKVLCYLKAAVSFVHGSFDCYYNLKMGLIVNPWEIETDHNYTKNNSDTTVTHQIVKYEKNLTKTYRPLSRELMGRLMFMAMAERRVIFKNL